VSQSAQYIDAALPILQKMGYEPEKYVYPDVTTDSEETSLVNHLKLFEERNLSLVRPPTSVEKRQVIMIISEMMSANKFEPDVDYKSREAIMRVIDSTAVRDSKSPGQPYQAQGLAVNSQVLERYTKEGFAEHVLQEWNSQDVQLKAFIKAEPTKVAKIEKGMPRIVTGMPLHKTIKNNCVFKNLNTKLVDEWKNSPVKFAFNPMRPGDIGHLANKLKKRVGESDKRNWDCNFFRWIADIVEGVVQELAERPADMTEEQFAEYKDDVASCFAEVFDHARYRTTNGHVYGTSSKGLMKSGWFFTIGGNSIGQLALHVLALLRMGVPASEIKSEAFDIVVGGDDILQTFPEEFDVDRYKREMSDLGFEVDDFHIHKEFAGCEFFSNRFFHKDGAWTYQPTRFTKHVAHLKRTKLDDLANALSCHMLNHVWDSSKFKFFDTMYRNLRKEHPDKFPLNLLKSQQQLKYKVLGLESA
jgi:hypothetical protein